ncbi:MAG TPA: hypothetical protein VE029_14280 [Rhizobacter sp.]|nr:hypothetical protein [Rhizobacter sp.]
MPRYKPAQRNGIFIPVIFEEQIQPGTFEFALRHLIDEEPRLRSPSSRRRINAIR